MLYLSGVAILLVPRKKQTFLLPPCGWPTNSASPGGTLSPHAGETCGHQGLGKFSREGSSPPLVRGRNCSLPSIVQESSHLLKPEMRPQSYRASQRYCVYKSTRIHSVVVASLPSLFCLLPSLHLPFPKWF